MVAARRVRASRCGRRGSVARARWVARMSQRMGRIAKGAAVSQASVEGRRGVKVTCEPGSGSRGMALGADGGVGSLGGARDVTAVDDSFWVLGSEFWVDEVLVAGVMVIWVRGVLIVL